MTAQPEATPGNAAVRGGPESARSPVVLYIATSLDGYIAAPDGDLDWLTSYEGEGDHGYGDFIEGIGALVMGSSTYELPLGESNWPYAKPTWVFSRRELPRPEGADVRFVSGPPERAISEIGASAGGLAIWLVGGGDLVGQFMEAGLLDEIIHFIVPKALGDGIPLFPGSVLNAFEVDSARLWPSGLTELRYRPAG